VVTWAYHPSLDSFDVQYAKLYCLGKPIKDVCPKRLLSQWLASKQKIKAYSVSISESRVSKDILLSSLIPKHVLENHLNLKSLICEHVLKTYPKPENYDFLLQATKLLYAISTKKVNFGNNSDRYCKYNLFGSKTGRLTTLKDSFPILTLKREDRVHIKPNNDLFIVMDYNSAELRTLNCLLGKENNVDDLHTWNVENLYDNSTTRDQAKKEFFAWLYNPECVNERLESHYNRQKLLEKYFDGEQIKNPFQRAIKCDNYHALNYLIQSTLTDLFLRQATKIFEKLQNSKSYISMLIHDSIVIDSCRQEKNILMECVDAFQDTCYGKFKASVKVGNNLGELK